MFLTEIPVGQISLPSVSFISAEKSGRGDVPGISGTRGGVLGTEEQKECGPSRTAVQIKTLSDVRDLGPPFLRSGEEEGKRREKKPRRMAKHAKQRQPHKAGLVGGHSEGGGAERGRERKTGREEEQCFQCRPSRLGLMGVSLLQFHFNRVTRRFICFAVLQPIEMLVREPMRRCMAPLCTNG